MDFASLCQEIREWQPISTAPKDGTPVLLSDGNLVEVGAYYDDASLTFAGKPRGPTWHTVLILSDLIGVTQGGTPVEHPKISLCTGSDATHWMPLPCPPEQTETGT